MLCADLGGVMGMVGGCKRQAIWLIHIIIQQKPTQRCKSNYPAVKKKKDKTLKLERLNITLQIAQLAELSLKRSTDSEDGTSPPRV